MRPFRFGIVAARAQSGAAWAERARQLEAAGVNILLLPDRLAGVLSAFPALAAAAAATTTLRIGTFVTVPLRHNNAQIALDTATLDFLSGGRFELGLGTGVSEADFARAGVAATTPGARIAALGETITAVRGFWQEFGNGQPQSYPSSVQQPGPPILIGSSGRRLLTLAAQQAEIVSVGIGRNRVDAAALSERIGWVREAAGERFAQLELSVNIAATVGAAGPSPQAVNRVRAILHVELADLIAAQSPFVLTGDTAAMVEQLLALREQWGISYIVLSDDQLDAIAPVIEQLAGR